MRRAWSARGLDVPELHPGSHPRRVRDRGRGFCTRYKRGPRDHPARARVAGVAGVLRTSPLRRSAGLLAAGPHLGPRPGRRRRTDVCPVASHTVPAGCTSNRSRSGAQAGQDHSLAHDDGFVLHGRGRHGFWPGSTVGHVLSGSSTRVEFNFLTSQARRPGAIGRRARPRSDTRMSATPRSATRPVRRSPALVGGRDDLLGHLPQLHVAVRRQPFEEREGVLVAQG